MSRNKWGLIGLLLVIGLVMTGRWVVQKINYNAISNFEECQAAGYPVMESYPEQCMLPNKKVFVREVTAGEEFRGTIVCLPKKADRRPMTLECAFGLEDDKGTYYGLKKIPQGTTIIQETGSRVKIKGKLVTNEESDYKIVGDIEVIKIERE